MVNDQTGDEKQASLNDLNSLRGDGYRVADTAAFDRINAEADAERRAKIRELEAQAPAAQAEQAAADRVYQDAVLTVQRTYPEAKGEAKRVDEGKVATDQPVETPPAAPGSVRARAEGEVAPVGVVRSPKPVSR